VSASQSIQSTGFKFVIGGTIPQDVPAMSSYVVRTADEYLYQSVCRGDIRYALTARQMGKSSFMVRTAARLRELEFGVAVLASSERIRLKMWVMVMAFCNKLAPDQRLGMNLAIGVEIGNIQVGAR
jgi:hypothetical protein